jgi:glucose/arabinose dehydrogenase
VLLQVDKPQPNHNGGTIAFGPDGYLYVPLGDGGGANDVGTGHAPEGNGQNTSTLLGKIIRIDVNNTSGGTYSIPVDNPFVGRAGYRPEIWAYGFRNPWRISFDKDGRLFASDAGQNLWEEVEHSGRDILLRS